MNILLQLPTLLGMLVAALVSVAITGGLFLAANRLLRYNRPEKTPAFLLQMARHVGTMHALVLALVFSIQTGELMKQFNLNNDEAIAVANIYHILTDHPSQPAARLRELAPEYLKTVIEKDWVVFSRRPYDLPAWKLIAEMQQIALEWHPKSQSDNMIKKYVFDNLNTIAENRNKRVIEKQSPNLPPIFWGIAFGGYFLTLIPYMCIRLTRLRLFLTCCYGAIIGLMFYGIAVLDNPFLSRAVKPSSFEVMYHDITDGSRTLPAVVLPDENKY